MLGLTSTFASSSSLFLSPHPHPSSLPFFLFHIARPIFPALVLPTIAVKNLVRFLQYLRRSTWSCTMFWRVAPPCSQLLTWFSTLTVTLLHHQVFTPTRLYTNERGANKHADTVNCIQCSLAQCTPPQQPRGHDEAGGFIKYLSELL